MACEFSTKKRYENHNLQFQKLNPLIKAGARAVDPYDAVWGKYGCFQEMTEM
jgi:hypothetical protein